MGWRAFIAAAGVAAWLVASTLSVAGAEDFDTSGLPKPPTTFEEQKLWDEIETARRYPSFAPEAHEKLAAYYDRKGLSALASKERWAAGGGTSAAPAPAPSGSSPQPVPVTSQPSTEPPSGQPPLEAAGPDTPSGEGPGQTGPSPETPADQPPVAEDQLDPNLFDLSAFPAVPTDFEEQLIRDSLDDPNTMASSFLLAFAHRQLGSYYAARGRADLAATEYSRAIVAAPEDHRGYNGLAALSESVGVEAGDGNVALRDVAQRLQEQEQSPEGREEPEPSVAPDPDPGQWQEVSIEFNRRMNYLYTSNAWSNVYRTVFTNLYGR